MNDTSLVGHLFSILLVVTDRVILPLIVNLHLWMLIFSFITVCYTFLLMHQLSKYLSTARRVLVISNGKTTANVMPAILHLPPLCRGWHPCVALGAVSPVSVSLCQFLSAPHLPGSKELTVLSSSGLPFSWGPSTCHCPVCPPVQTWDGAWAQTPWSFSLKGTRRQHIPARAMLA